MSSNRIAGVSIAFAVMILSWSSVAFAIEQRQFYISNTGDLYKLCTTPVEDPLRPQAINYCIAYLDGAVDYHDAVTDRSALQRLICYPNTATLEQGVLVFIDWAEKNQGDKALMGQPTVIGLVKALAAKWPCKQS